MVDFTDDFSTYAVSKLPIFRDNFNYSTQALGDISWVPVGTDISVNPVTEVMDWDVSDASINHATAFDLAFIASNRWVLRAKITVNNVVAGTDANTNRLYFGLFDSNQSVDSNTVQDGLFIGFARSSTGNEIGLYHRDGAVLDANADVIFSTTITATTFFVEIKRTSETNVTITLFSDVNYSVIIESQTATIPSTILDLRFIKAQNRSTLTGDSTLDGTIDDIEFWDEGETPTFFDTFTSDQWVDTGTGYGVNTVTEKLDVAFELDGADNHTSFDLQTILGAGNFADAEQWVLRFKVNISSLSHSPQTGLAFAISDTEAGGGLALAQDNFSGVIDLFSPITEGYGIGNTDFESSLPLQAFPGSFKQVVDIVTGTDYYVELKREGLRIISMRIFTDTGFSVPLAGLSRKTDLSTTITNLRYIKFFEREISSGGTLIYTIDNLQFFDGVTVVQKRLGAQQGDITFQDDFVLKPVTFSDDFTTDNFTNIAGTKVSVNTGTGVIDWSSSVNAVYNEGEFNDIIGSVINTDNWILRCKLVINTATAGVDTTANDLFIGFSDSDTALPQNASDFIGWRWGMNNPDGVIRTLTSDGLAINSSPGGGGNLFDTPITTGTFYLETKRSGSNVIGTIYSDANFTQVVETQTDPIEVGITGLRYLKVMVSNVDGSADSTFDGTIDDIQFYNGNSTLTDWISSVTLDTTTGTVIAVDTTAEAIAFHWINHNVSDTIFHDLQNDDITVSETDWTLRCKATFSQVGGATIHAYCIGLYDSDAQDSGVAQDWIHIFISNVIALRAGDGVDLNNISAIGGTPVLTVPTVGVPVFWELKRIGGTTLRLRQYSDAQYSNLIDEASITDLPSTINNLRYIKCLQRNDFTALEVEGIFEDIEFYNGVAVSKTPIVEVKKFEDRFEVDNWSDAGTGVGVNTGTQVIDWSSAIDGVNNSTVVDLGNNQVSDTAWALRFKFTTASLTAGSSTGKYFWIGMFSGNETADSETAQDAIAFYFLVNSGNPNGVYNLAERNSVVLSNAGTNSILNQTATASDIFYIELKRLSATLAELTLYSDPDYTQVIERTTLGISSGIQNLRFIGLKNRNITAETGEMSGTVDDVQFWTGGNAVTNENVWKRIDL